jgi:hypothetical protein
VVTLSARIVLHPTLPNVSDSGSVVTSISPEPDSEAFSPRQRSTQRKIANMKWFVSATRNNTTVHLPATLPATDKEQSRECDAMVANLKGHGWHDLSIEAY